MIKKPDPKIALDDDDKLKDREPSGDLETVVGPSVHVQGEFKSKGDIIVKGIVSGDVETEQNLTIETNAEVEADVKANNAVVSGLVKGSVTVANELDVNETATIQGDIECSTLKVAPGAVIQGNINMEKGGGSTSSSGSSVKKQTGESKEEGNEEGDE